MAASNKMHVLRFIGRHDYFGNCMARRTTTPSTTKSRASDDKLRTHATKANRSPATTLTSRSIYKRRKYVIRTNWMNWTSYVCIGFVNGIESDPISDRTRAPMVGKDEPQTQTLHWRVIIPSLDRWPHQFNSNHNNTKRMSWLRPQIRPIRIHNPRSKSKQSKNDHRNDITIYYRNVEMRCTIECFESVDVINERTSHIRRSNAPPTLFANDLISDLFISFAFWRISKFYCCFYDFHFVFRCNPLRRYGLCHSARGATHTCHCHKFHATKYCGRSNKRHWRMNVYTYHKKGRSLRRRLCEREVFFSWCMFVQLFGYSAD